MSSDARKTVRRNSDGAIGVAINTVSGPIVVHQNTRSRTLNEDALDDDYLMPYEFRSDTWDLLSDREKLLSTLALSENRKRQIDILERDKDAFLILCVVGWITAFAFICVGLFY